MSCVSLLYINLCNSGNVYCFVIFSASDSTANTKSLVAFYVFSPSGANWTASQTVMAALGHISWASESMVVYHWWAAMAPAGATTPAPAMAGAATTPPTAPTAAGAA